MLVDLTHPIHEGMLVFPGGWHPDVGFETLGRLDTEARRTSRLTLGTHTGTHIDAPSHFIEDGCSIDQIPLEILVGNAELINLSMNGPRAAITAEDLEHGLGDRRPAQRLILRFDWARRYSNVDFYNESPFLTREAAQWVIDNGVRMLGYDTPSPDNPLDSRESACDSPVHKLLLGSDVWLVEYLCNLHLLPETFEFIALPLTLRGLDGSPARCLGRVSST
jgi:arylformamidase